MHLKQFLIFTEFYFNHYFESALVSNQRPSFSSLSFSISATNPGKVRSKSEFLTVLAILKVYLWECKRVGYKQIKNKDVDGV